MAFQRWHAARGPRPSNLITSWLTSNGGGLTIILCVPTKHSAWRSRSRENEGASVWINPIGTALLRWQLAELADDGRRGKCSPTHCHWFPLERHSSQRWVQSHVAGSLIHVLAEALDWSLTPGSGSFLDCLLTKNSLKKVE